MAGCIKLMEGIREGLREGKMSNIRKSDGSMATALEPLARRLRDQTGLIRPVSRAAFEVKGERAFEETIRRVVAWMKVRSSSIPEAALIGEQFDVGGGGHHPAEAVRLDDDGSRLWAAILDDADKDVARRTWVTEVTVGERDGRTAFGARLFNVAKGIDAPFVPSRPGMVHGIIAELEAEADGMPLLPRVERIKCMEDFEKFWELLLLPQRTLPVIVMTDMADVTPTFTQNALCTRVSGLAHLVELTDEMSWELTNRVGRKLSVFEGATRIYSPDFDPTEASPFDHGLWLRRVSDADEDRERRFTQIVTWVLTNSVRSSRIPNFPRFPEIRRWADERRSKAAKTEGQTDATLVALYEEELARLTAALEVKNAEHDEWLSQTDASLRSAEALEKAAKDESRLLRLRLDALQHVLRDNNRDLPDEPLERYEDIETWAEKHLVGSIWIAPKAIRETRKADFADLGQFWKTLIMLRDFYVPMRRSPGATQRTAYEKALREFGLEDSRCFGNSNDIKGFPEYKVTYGREELWCDDHIKFGAGYDSRNMFRIYYHWHQDDQTLLIGHMPTHLDNTRTN